MQVSPQTQAVLLLTAHFSKPSVKGVKPLTPTEWGQFALWLKDNQKEPETLLRGDLRELLSGWSDRQVTENRVRTLLDRGSALAVAMEKWQRSGLWVLTRSDADYPWRLKQRLKTASPPIIFGCGNAKLLNQRGVAVVGSRSASEAALNYAAKLGATTAGAGLTIISGGARGVDEAAMLGALEVDGVAVGVLADSLLRACTSQKYRKHIARKNLVLVSTCYPEAGFSAGNAMGRNKYIYCLADRAVVVHSGRKGGTWNGAIENLKKGWVPIWVKPSEDSSAGNADIVGQGGCWAPETVSPEMYAVLLDSEQTPRTDAGLPESHVREPIPTDLSVAGSDAISGGQDSHSAPCSAEPTRETISDASLYAVFLLKLQTECTENPLKPEDIAERLGLQKSQLNAWLKQAVAEKKVKKLTRPVRYEWQVVKVQQTIFEN